MVGTFSLFSHPRIDRRGNRFELGLESICAIALPESTSLPSKTPAQLAEEKQDREQVLKRREEGRGEVVEEMEDRDEMLSKGTQRRKE